MGKSIRGQQRPVSRWRNVRYLEVRAAVLGLLLVWDAVDRDRRGGWSLCADEVERMRRALVLTADLDDGTDLAPPLDVRDDGRTRYRAERVPRGAPARDRAYALYDACCDFLSVFLGGDRSPSGPAWDRAGKAIREAIILAPGRRTPPRFTNGLAPRGT